MKRFSHACLFVVLLALSALGYSQSSDANVPAELSDDARPVAWVAADVAIGPDGIIRSDKLKEYAPFVQRDAAFAAREAGASERTQGVTTTSPCRTFLLTNPETAPTRTPEELASRAVTIVRGRIVGVREGFYFGMPGSLVRLAGSFLRGNPTDEIYLFYPTASIATADGMVCARPHERFGAPRVGDEVIVFDPTPAPVVLHERTILWVRIDEHVVYIPSAGNPILPEPLSSLSATDDPIASVLAIASMKAAPDAS